MTTYFIRPGVGSDSNAGTSFGAPWKTVIHASVHMSPGDIARIEKSPDPTSMSQNATFTQFSNSITLVSAVTKNVTLCESNFTALSGVTSSLSTNRQQGSNSVELAISSGFGTGLLAYFPLGAVTDFSAFQQLSFKIMSSVAVNAGTLKLALCSDAAGATIVNSVTINELLQANAWTPITIDTGAALSSSIQSVALYAVTTPGAVNVFLDNILACKAPSAPDSLTLNSLIGTNLSGDTWYALESINDAALVIASDPMASTPAQSRGYPYSTVTTTAFKRESFTLGLVTFATNCNQIFGNSQTFTGGWDPSTSMTSQTGETWFDGRNGNGVGLFVNSSSLGSTFGLSDIALIRFQKAVDVSGASEITLGILSTSFCHLDGDVSANACDQILWNGPRWSICNAGNGMNPQQSSGGYIYVGNFDAHCNGGDGGIFTNAFSGSPYYFTHSGGTWSANNNNGYGINGSAMFLNFDQVSFESNVQPQAMNDTGFGYPALQINNLKSSGHTSSILFNAARKLRILQNNAGSIGDTNLFDFNNLPGGGFDIVVFNIPSVPSNPLFNMFSGPSMNARVRFQNVAGNVQDDRIFTDGGEIKLQTSVVEGASPVAVQFSPTQTRRNQYLPLTESIKRVPVDGTKPITITADIQVSSTSMLGQLRILGGRVPGIGTDVTAAANPPADSAFHSFSVGPVTPTGKGVIECVFDAWNGTTTTDSSYVTNVKNS